MATATPKTASSLEYNHGGTSALYAVVGGRSSLQCTRFRPSGRHTELFIGSDGRVPYVRRVDSGRMHDNACALR